MEFLMEFLRSDTFLISILLIGIILLILYVLTIVKLNQLKRKYTSFMKKVGNGENLQQSIEKYMKRIEKVEEENTDIKNYCKQLDNTIQKCIQKVGLVRYSAFKDTGSDLSFTLALLDEYNTGVVLNGIYSREMSNIYSKPIQNGTSTYTLSEEEKEAIKKAVKH